MGTVPNQVEWRRRARGQQEQAPRRRSVAPQVDNPAAGIMGVALGPDGRPLTLAERLGMPLKPTAPETPTVTVEASPTATEVPSDPPTVAEVPTGPESGTELPSDTAAAVDEPADPPQDAVSDEELI